MLTYQIRPRIFRLDPGSQVSFPADCLVRLHFLPKQPFGAEGGGGRTTVLGKGAVAYFNANTGAHSVESSAPLAPLEVVIEEPSRRVTLKGTVLEVAERFATLQELEQHLTGLYFALPMLLNVDLADPPIVERVDGQIGATGFRWELREWRIPFQTTTQETQEQRVIDAWLRLEVVGGIANRRFLAALHYFHAASRLRSVAATPGEFMAEVILNLSKTLEVMFPPSGDGMTRDAARQGLRRLGYSDQRIETDFLPAVALRNEIDVGHVDLSLFSLSQLKHIHSYTERAEDAFRELLSTALIRARAGQWAPPSYQQHPLSSATLEVLDRRSQVPSDDAA